MKMEEIRPKLEAVMSAEDSLKKFMDEHLGKVLTDEDIQTFDQLYIARYAAWEAYRAVRGLG